MINPPPELEKKNRILNNIKTYNMANLKQNIEALNAHNEATKNYYLTALEQVSKLVGKKVRTAKNERAAIFNVNLERIKGPFNNNHLDIHTWFNFTGRSIWLHVKTCYNGGSYDVKPVTAFCIYIENNLYIGETDDNGKLLSIANQEVQNSWLNTLVEVKEDEILLKAEQYKEKRKEGDEIYKSIPEHLRKVLYLDRY